MPSVRATLCIRASGFLVATDEGVARSWSLVLANSKGYYFSKVMMIIMSVIFPIQTLILTVQVASTPPATPPAIKETAGDT